MRLRPKAHPEHECFSDRFNVHGMSEIIVCYPEGDQDSAFISDFEVWLDATQDWKDLSQAFKDHDVIVDNYNTCFCESQTPEDRERGFYL